MGWEGENGGEGIQKAGSRFFSPTFGEADAVPVGDQIWDGKGSEIQIISAEEKTENEINGK